MAKRERMSHQKKSSTNVVWHGGSVSRCDRETALGQRGCVLWFTGLSGSGKSTVACCLEQQLESAGHHTYLLDGDNVRHGLNGDLSFSEIDRKENIRRIGEVAALFADAGLMTLTAFISPFRADRTQARTIIERAAETGGTGRPETADLSPETSDSPRSEAETHQSPGEGGQPPPSFIEIFIDTPLEICEARDPKNLYKKARAGDIPHFTGISSPYEPPEKPEITIRTANMTPEEAAAEIMRHLEDQKIIPKAT